MWWVFYVLAAIALLLHWRGGPNAVWGTATAGLVIGIGTAIIMAIMGYGFHGWTIAKSVAIAAMIGVLIERLPRLIDRKGRPPSMVESSKD